MIVHLLNAISAVSSFHNVLIKKWLKKIPWTGDWKQRIEMMKRLVTFVSDVDSISSSEFDYILTLYM